MPSLLETLLHEILDIPFDEHEWPRSRLRNYQVHCSNLIKSVWNGKIPGIILSLDMGAGKSASTLTALTDLLAEGKIRKPLLVAPLLVANTVWPDEIEKWEHISHLSYSILTGSAKRREEAALSDAQIHIINKDNLPWLWDFFGRGAKWPYDALIIDEASMLKNGKKRTKLRKLTRFGTLALARKYATGVIELTGTPSPNGVQNLWGLSYIVDQGERLGRTKKAFEDRYLDVNRFTFEVKPKPGAVEQITTALKDIMVILHPEDYAELPAVVTVKRTVKFSEKLMKEYRRFKQTLVSEEYDLEAVNAAVLTNKLLQWCIAEGTEVLTDRGWTPIECVTESHRVWDGIDWVACSGNICNGIQQTVDCFNVRMTANHSVLTKDGWKTAGEILNGDASSRFEREGVRLPDGHSKGRYVPADQEGDMVVPLHLRKGGGSPEPKSALETSSADEILRVPTRGSDFGRARRPYDDGNPPVGHMAIDAPSLSESRGQGLQKLRWPWNRYAGRMVRLLRGVLERCEGRLRRTSKYRPCGQYEELRERQLPLDYDENADAEHEAQRFCGNAVGTSDDCRGCGTCGAEVRNCSQAIPKRLARERVATGSDEIAVYDLLNCGPRHRFVVRGSDGLPLIVHNCNGSAYQEEGKDVWIHDLKLDALASLVEELDGTPLLVAYSFKFDLARIKGKFPNAVVLNESEDVRQTVRDWNAGRIPMLLAHPMSAAHGINAQFGSNQAVWYGLNSDLELYQQFNKRLVRPGQKADTVFLHHIIAEGTHDEAVLPLLNKKQVTQDEVLAAVRVTLGS